MRFLDLFAVVELSSRRLCVKSLPDVLGMCAKKRVRDNETAMANFISKRRLYV